MSKELAFQFNSEQAPKFEEQYNNELVNSEEKYSKRNELISKLQSQTIDLSYSWAKEMLKSPSHFINYKLKDYTPPTDGMIFGSAVDCLITEPYNFDKNFAILDKNFAILDKVPSTENQINFCNLIISGLDIETAFNQCYKRGKAIEVYNELATTVDNISTLRTAIDNLVKEIEA